MDIQADIRIDNVSFAYTNQLVLENVNLSVKRGDFASIVGPNGSGKTTLLKLLLGLLKPDKGEIRILDKSPKEARLQIGYMPQYSILDNQFPVSVMDIVLMGRLGRNFGGWYSKQDREVALSSLEEVELEGLSKRHFNELSGGQRQRVLIARALCCQPEILILDEPTANIDPVIEETLFDLLRQLNERMTILLVSHDPNFVSEIVGSVICVNQHVVTHPTSEISADLIKKVCGEKFRIIRHDQQCAEGIHRHD